MWGDTKRNKVCGPFTFDGACPVGRFLDSDSALASAIFVSLCSCVLAFLMSGYSPNCRCLVTIKSFRLEYRTPWDGFFLDCSNFCSR